MNTRHSGAIPFVLLLLPFIIGILTGINFKIFSLSTALTILTVLTGIFIALNLTYAKLKVYKAGWTGGLLLALILWIAGIVCVGVNKQIDHPKHFSHHKADHLLIKISDEPLLKSKTWRFSAVVENAINHKVSKPVSGKLLISIQDSLGNKLSYGDVLLVPAKHQAIDPPFNPAEFNYKQYLANKNIYHQAYLYPGEYILVKSDKGNALIGYALKLRKRLVAKLHANMHNTGAGAVASTLILGYKADLSNDILQAFSKTGTIHVLSVSGAHVGLIYAVLLFALAFLKRLKHGVIIQAVVIIVLIWLYALLTGFSPPVCRASAMLSLIIAGKTYSRYISTLNILGFSAFVMLLFTPLLITDVGFQLSYLAVAGLIVLQPVIYKLISIKNTPGDMLWRICAASIAAQAATLPLSAYYFHQVPVYFLISNLFILLPSAIIMYGGILYLLLPQDFFVAKWLGYLLEHVIVFTTNALKVIEYAPFSVINKVWLTPLELVLLCGIIVLAFMYLNKRNKRLIVLTTSLVVAFNLSVGIKKHSAQNSVETVFMNVRKNIAVVFRHGDKSVVFTNIPVSSKAYKYSVQPYLDSAKVKEATIVNLHTNAHNSFFKKQASVIHFGNRDIALIDSHTDIIPEADIYFFTAVNKNIATRLPDGKMYVVNGSINTNRSAAIINQARKTDTPYKLLARNKALILTSK